MAMAQQAAEHKVVKIDAPGHKRPGRVRELLEELEADGWAFKDTVTVGGSDVALIVMR